MKLPIKDKYFKQIKNGTKQFEYRDSHITFINEKTKEELRCDVWSASVVSKQFAVEESGFKKFTDERIIRFALKENV